jgi:hypothetical protein
MAFHKRHDLLTVFGDLCTMMAAAEVEVVDPDHHIPLLAMILLDDDVALVPDKVEELLNHFADLVEYGVFAPYGSEPDEQFVLSDVVQPYIRIGRKPPAGEIVLHGVANPFFTFGNDAEGKGDT